MATPTSGLVRLTAAEGWNSAEGGTTGTNVTVGNSGGQSGTAWEFVALATNGTVTYTDTVVADGQLAYANYGGGTNAGNFTTLRRNVTAAGLIHARFWFRTTTADHIGIIRFSGNTGFFPGQNAGKFVIRNFAGAIPILVTGAANMAADTWYQIELRAQAGVGCTMRIYNAAGALLDTLVYTGAEVPAGNTAAFLYCGYTRGATTQYIDNVEWSTTTALPSVAHTVTPDSGSITLSADPDTDTAPNSGATLTITAGDSPTITFAGPPYYGDPIATTVGTRANLPAHILGVGPANGSAPWRGAPNHGVGGGSIARPSRPAFPLPAATARRYTLRLTGENEASTTHEFDRAAALIIEEHFVDLWWRRQDPKRATLDIIGRYNADKVDTSGNGPLISVSVSWIDYRVLLGRRLILAWKDTVAKTSTWVKGATVAEIIRFALPTNMNLDVTDATTVDLGVTKEIFNLPVGTPLATVMTNLQAVSGKKWEWWIDTPTTDTNPPKLRLLVGGRGTDRGITLYDVDGMRGPVESWTRNTSGEDYANSLFFSGKDGGVVIQLPAHISLYGQHDAADSDNSIGTGKQLDAAADKRLQELATREPTYTVVLRQGWWEGRQHIDVGDWINVYFKLGAELVTGKHQVTEISGDVDANNVETVTLTLGPPKASGDPRSPRSAVSRIVKRLKDATPKGTVTTT